MDNFSSESLLDKREFVSQIISPAPWGKRLANYIVDSIISSIVAIGIMFVFALIWAFVVDEDIFTEMGDMNPIVDHILTFLLRAICYYIPMEYFTGKTIGKMITRTKVVTEEGDKVGLGDIIFRNFTRIIPLNVFSFLSNNPIGWHDKAGGSMVVEDIPLYNLDMNTTSFYEEEEKY